MFKFAPHIRTHSKQKIVHTEQPAAESTEERARGLLADWWRASKHTHAGKLKNMNKLYCTHMYNTCKCEYNTQTQGCLYGGKK